MIMQAEMIVQGVVQGVGFRYYTVQEARQLGIVGSVANLVNGDVKVVAEGERSALLTLIKNLRIGPSFSHVTDVVVEWREATHKFDNFSIVHF